jgi:hypothetical protein
LPRRLVPRQPVKVPSSPGAPVFAVLMMGRLAVNLVNSDFVRSPLVPPPKGTCPAGQWTSSESSAPLAGSLAAWLN